MRFLYLLAAVAVACLFALTPTAATAEPVWLIRRQQRPIRWQA
jgi:hypothetical protein